MRSNLAALLASSARAAELRVIATAPAGVDPAAKPKPTFSATCAVCGQRVDLLYAPPNANQARYVCDTCEGKRLFNRMRITLRIQQVLLATLIVAGIVLGGALLARAPSSPNQPYRPQ